MARDSEGLGFRGHRHHAQERLVAFGAEELGLFGSQDYANKMSAADQDALWAVLNLDMVGWDGGILLAERYGSVSLKLQNRILGVAADLGIPINGGVSDGGSDHVPFANRGIPAVHFWTGMDPFNHSSGDTLDKINPASLEAAGRVVVETAYRLVQ